MSFDEEVKALQGGEVKEEVIENVIDDTQDEDEPIQVEEQHEDDDKDEVDEQADGENAHDDSDEDAAKKQQAYRDRRKQKLEQEKQREANQSQYQQTVDNTVKKAESNPLEPYIPALQKIHENELMDKDEVALKPMEDEFKEAFTDYDDVVEKALGFTKKNLIKRGMTERQASDHLRREKLVIANKAHMLGQDPVEAIYNEAKNIVDVLDSYAVELGYTKAKPKTNLQAAKEMSKPNAMTGGKGSAAAKKTFSELDDDDMDEISNMTLSDMGW